jgi:glutamine---fructose-6-phosphate transaminase (isomerizing)
VIFIVLNDEHQSQVLSNILQVKERGATTIIVTNLPSITDHIDICKLDFLIQLPVSGETEVLAGLQAIIPLQMICYYSSLEQDLNPDTKLFEAIDFANEFE